MITLSRIQRAAKIVAADILGASNSPLINAADMFIRGAKWYIGHIWHTSSEKPTHFFFHDKVTLILLRANMEESTIQTFTHKEINKIFLSKRFRKYDPSIIAWAYLEEINPHTTQYYYGDR